jgi:hypothetical protein
MEANLTGLTYGSCGLLIVVYAWDRFNTPPSNRSSTRRSLYWSSCAGYILTALALFVALSMLLEVAPWRQALLATADDPALPAPLIAALAMTTLLSSCPTLKNLDSWILRVFLEWGAIPAEVKRRVATMTPQSFSVTAEDVAALREAYADGSYGDTLAGHLRERGSEGLELSQFRFTRVVKLYDRIQKLAGESRYARFFSETADELAELDKRVSAFLHRSDTSLTLAARLRAQESEVAYEELMLERREAFAQSCREIFNDLALFLARAVLRGERSERDIVDRLRTIGFAAAEPMNEPDFPIDGLTLLALGVFLYLAALSVFFSQVTSTSHVQGTPLMMAFKVALTRLVTVGVTLWLVQRFSFFRREAREAPKYFAYVVCGILACVVAAGICLPFALFEADLMTGMNKSAPLILLSGVLGAALALCCNDWPDDSTPPAWLRPAEAAGCASVMVVGTTLIYYGGMLTTSLGALQGWMVGAWIALPSAMALMFGFFVPHIYRKARLAAAARRNGASRIMAMGQQEQRQLPRPAHALAGPWRVTEEASGGNG